MIRSQLYIFVLPKTIVQGTLGSKYSKQVKELQCRVDELDEGEDSESKPESSNFFQSLLAREPTVPRLRRTGPCSPGTWRTLEPGPMSKVL